MRRRYCRWILTLALLATLGQARADLQEQMDDMFGSMLNFNNPTAYQGQRRGVLSGGSLYLRNRIMNPNLITLTPPSWKGGCGGIDLYAGSFSFISADEFMQLLRAVAANAPGYAFELAMNAMCPTCQQEMARLSNVVRELNQMLGNSCQLAQGLVTDAFSALTGKQQQQSGLIATLSGAASDFLQGLRPSDNKSPTKTAQDADPAQVKREIKGNVVWRALKERNAGAWFQFGDDPFLEAIMSLTGSIIVGDIPNGQEEHEIREIEPILTLQDILVGSGSGNQRRISVWTCDDHDPDGCLQPHKDQIDLKGMTERVEAVLLGDANHQGLVAKFRFNVGPPTAAEKAFMELAPGSVVAMIRNLAVNDGGLAMLLAKEAIPVIALEMTYELVEDMTRAVRQAAALNQHHLEPAMRKKLEDAHRLLAEERKALHDSRSRLADLMAFYSHLRLSLQNRTYQATRALTPSVSQPPTE